MATEVHKLTGTEVVLVLWPPGGGPSLVRVDGSWMPAKDWGSITFGDLLEDWLLVRDESEASRLAKDAISATSDKPADSAAALNAAS